MGSNPELRDFLDRSLKEGVRGLSEEHKQTLIQTDRRTGALNPKGLETYMESIKAAVDRGLMKRLTAVFFDIDNFKGLQDRKGFGYEWGNEALTQFSAAAVKSVRHTDEFVRYGGDEFVMLLPDAEDEDVSKVLARLWKALDENPVRFDGTETRLRATYGVAVYPAVPLERLVEEAGRKMKKMKEKLGSGRGR